MFIPAPLCGFFIGIIFTLAVLLLWANLSGGNVNGSNQD